MNLGFAQGDPSTIIVTPSTNSSPILKTNTPIILVIGDSLSAAHGMPIERGWVFLLAERLQKESLSYQVVNLSTSGDTSSNGLDKLPGALQQYKPRIVIIGLGSNDGLRGLSIKALENNLKSMITLSEAAGARVMLLDAVIPINYGPAYRQQFEAVFPNLASAHHIPLVPFVLKSIALDANLMQSDRLHPNEAAQPIILENVWTSLRPLL